MAPLDGPVKETSFLALTVLAKAASSSRADGSSDAVRLTILVSGTGLIRARPGS